MYNISPLHHNTKQSLHLFDTQWPHGRSNTGWGWMEVETTKLSFFPSLGLCIFSMNNRSHMRTGVGSAGWWYSAAWCRRCKANTSLFSTSHTCSKCLEQNYLYPLNCHSKQLWEGHGCWNYNVMLFNMLKGLELLFISSSWRFPCLACRALLDSQLLGSDNGWWSRLKVHKSK